MKRDYILYAQKIKDIGERICEISNNRTPISTERMSIEELRNSHLELQNLINSYKKCKLDLLEINPPNMMQQEHEGLTNAIQMFITGAESMYKGIDLGTFSVDEIMIIEGTVIEKQAEILTVNSVDSIVDKLIND